MTYRRDVNTELAPSASVSVVRRLAARIPAVPEGRRGLCLAVQAVLLAIFVLLPFAAPLQWNLQVATNALLFGLAATSVNLALGLGGILNLGSAFFIGTGAYGTALAMTKLGWPFVPAAVASIAVSVVLAVVVGVLLLRMPRFYLAVATLGLSVALEGILLAFNTVTGGDSGIIGERAISLGVFTVASDWAWYVLVVLVCAAALMLVHRAARGRRGRLLAITRSDELAASVLGVRVLRAKVTIFAASACLLATAGALMFAFVGVIVPATAGVIQSVQMLGMSVVGGMGFVSGGIVGASILNWLQALVSGATYESLIYGTAFLLVVFFARPGIAGVVSALWKRLWGEVARDRSDGSIGEVRLVTAGPPGVKADARIDPAVGRGIAANPMPANRCPPEGDHDAAARWLAGGTATSGLVAASVVKSFGGLTAVDEVSVVVPAGAVTGLIGTNGAGKSTFLNVVSGVEPADRGSIVLNGCDLTRSTPAERASAGIARTFQTPRLVDHCTVLENVMIGRDATHGTVFRRQSRQQETVTRNEAMFALERVGLAGIASRPAGSLGGGERRFVELLRALILQPQVLLMDEPAVGLSIEEIDSVASWIREIAVGGTAVLLIDHNMDFIADLTDYVYSMESGRIVAQGPAGATTELTRSWDAMVGKDAE